MSKSEVREFVGKANYCDVLTGSHVAVAAEFDLACGRTSCSYSVASVKLCNSELEMYIDAPADKRGEATTPL